MISAMRTHDLAHGLISRQNEIVHILAIGRFSIVWDLGKPVQCQGCLCGDHPGAGTTGL